jgi:hypothetical protein
MKTFIITILAVTVFCAALYAQEVEPVVLHRPAPEDQFKAADQSLMVMPTAYTMPKGASSITDYELFIIQYSYGITSRTHLSAGMVFPIHKELFKSFTIGLKQNYYNGTPLQAAFMCSYNPHYKTGAFGNVLSVGDYRASLHGAAFWVVNKNDISSDYAMMLGGIVMLSKRASLISEFITTSDILDQEANGMITLGVRLKSEKLSLDIGGFRPLSNGGDMIMFPLLKGTFLF